MIRREPDGARILAEIGQPQRLCVADQHPQDAAPTREVADQSAALIVDPGRDELAEFGAGVVEHAESRIPRAGERAGGIDDAAQHLIHLQAACHSKPGLEQCLQPLGARGRRRIDHARVYENRAAAGSPQAGAVAAPTRTATLAGRLSLTKGAEMSHQIAVIAQIRPGKRDELEQLIDQGPRSHSRSTGSSDMSHSWATLTWC